MNKRQIKEVRINFNKSWDPQKYDVVLKYDPVSNTGFSIDIVSVDYEPKITNFSEANEILKKFKNERKT
jgi:hypothetical protein